MLTLDALQGGFYTGAGFERQRGEGREESGGDDEDDSGEVSPYEYNYTTQPLRAPCYNISRDYLGSHCCDL